MHRSLPVCKVLILTTFGRPGYLRRAMESGVVGFWSEMPRPACAAKTPRLPRSAPAPPRKHMLWPGIFPPLRRAVPDCAGRRRAAPRVSIPALWLPWYDLARGPLDNTASVNESHEFDNRRE